MAWLVAPGAVNQLGDMRREFPSTPKEAFEASVEGAYLHSLAADADVDVHGGAPGAPRSQG